jgi:hypothetical protein
VVQISAQASSSTFNQTKKLMNITGTIKVIQATEQITEKFSKRAFVITTKGEYPQLIQMELQNARTGTMDGFNVGDEIDCEFDLRGRAWTSPSGEVKYFNTIVCSRISFIARSPQPAAIAGPSSDDSEIPF